MYKRLRKEAADAQRSTEPDLVLAPQQDNLQSWRAWVAGPTDTPFEGGVFELELNIGVRYPLAPPVVRVTTPLFHPNIHDRTGEVCLDILKEAWSPAWTLVSVVRAVRALLAAPNADSPLNCDAGNLAEGRRRRRLRAYCAAHGRGARVEAHALARGTCFPLLPMCRRSRRPARRLPLW